MTELQTLAALQTQMATTSSMSVPQYRHLQAQIDAAQKQVDAMPPAKVAPATARKKKPKDDELH